MAYDILIVDDSATVRRMMIKTLGMAGVDIAELHQAANGREALDLLQENWVDVVFTDINMPEMDGMEFVRQMSADGVMKLMPVVVVTTEGSEARIQELREMGIRGFLRKPFTPEAIRDVVTDILGGQADDPGGQDDNLAGQDFG